MFIKLPMYLFFYMALGLNDFDADKLLANGTRFARCHFRTRKSVNFQGPPLPMALVMDVARIKIITAWSI
jgi:hypothetical protein